MQYVPGHLGSIHPAVFPVDAERALESPGPRASLQYAFQEGAPVMSHCQRQVGVEFSVRLAGCNVDQRRHRVGAVKRRVGAQNDLDEVDVVYSNRDYFVERLREEFHVEFPPVED